MAAVGSVSSLPEIRVSSPARRDRIAIVRVFGVFVGSTSSVESASVVVRLSPVGGASSARIVTGGCSRGCLSGRSCGCGSWKSRLVVEAGPGSCIGPDAVVVVDLDGCAGRNAIVVVCAASV